MLPWRVSINKPAWPSEVIFTLTFLPVSQRYELRAQRVYQKGRLGPPLSVPPSFSRASGVLLRAHGDALEKAQRDNANHQVAAPVADKRQRDTGNWHKPHCHPYVNENVKEENGADTDGDEDTEAVLETVATWSIRQIRTK